MEARHTWSSEWTEVKSYLYCVLVESTTQDQGDKMSTGHASQTESVIVSSQPLREGDVFLQCTSSCFLDTFLGFRAICTFGVL
jgi:hypothetical protein